MLASLFNFDEWSVVRMVHRLHKKNASRNACFLLASDEWSMALFWFLIKKMRRREKCGAWVELFLEF